MARQTFLRALRRVVSLAFAMFRGGREVRGIFPDSVR